MNALGRPQSINRKLSNFLAVLSILGAALLTSCTDDRPASFAQTDPVGPNHLNTLVMVARGEPDTLSTLDLTRSTGPRFVSLPRLFNAGLVIFDAQESPRPYLAQQIPQLQSDSWRVLDDGRMETTYVLRQNLTWHDGNPLVADDFVFGWQVFQQADPSQSQAAAIFEIENVAALDPRTVQIRWGRLVPRAGSLDAKDFVPLPRHLLQEAFQRETPQAFSRQPFWKSAYIGLGPYRLSDWVPGQHLTAAAFEAHAHGQPKIQQVKVLFADGFDAVLNSLLSGEAQVTIDDALRFAQASVLKRDWVAHGAGTLLSIPNQWRHLEVQHRAEYANPRAIVDLRVRRAIALSLDKDALNAGLFEGDATVADSFVPPTVDYYRVVDAAVVKYPLDSRRAERLMNESGYYRGLDGTYVHPTDGRFVGELRANATPQGETEVGLLAEAWRREGFDLHQTTLPPAQTRMGEIRSTFPTLYSVSTPLGNDTLASFISNRISGPGNRWVGNNRGGWSNRDYDVLYDAFSKTLDRTERTNEIAEMARLVTHSVAAIPLYFNPGIVAYATSLQGPHTVSPGSDPIWNIHQWEWVGPPVR